ncbi:MULTISPECIES: DUF2946 family protein [Xanthomonas]|uniref:DUF2946 family protein n=1 Tax=Xanthomonas TaxID=338 RepID=UPI0009ECBB5F|nr:MULTISPECIES: DUF2946 family protein [Xanthomonas]
MRQRRTPLRTFAWLAIMAAMLMAVAPVVSRLAQAAAVAPPIVSELCHHGETAVAAIAEAATPTAHARGGAPIGSDHTRQHDACDYCALAARMLPVLLAVWLPLAAPAPPVFASPDTLPIVTGRFRYAHAPRGPPASA